jgi:hypothetical protein
MTTKEINKAVEACVAKSLPFLIVEYRGGKGEEIKYVAKKGEDKGKQTSFMKMTLSCETCGEESSQIVVSRDFTESEKAIAKAGKAEDVKTGFKKGARLFIVLGQYVSQYGKTECRAISIEEVKD